MLPDVQKTKPDYGYPIKRVGVTNIKLPIYITEKNYNIQHSVADIDIFVDLENNQKGIHMSRLQQGIFKFRNDKLDQDTLIKITSYIKEKLGSQLCQIIYKFPYFITKTSPVSDNNNIINCKVCFNYINNSPHTDMHNFTITVTTTTTSLCPCSKDISDNGAHNQRSLITIACECCPGEIVWIEDLVEISEKSASCEIYNILKREDEKYVTEKAYNNPKFVEDTVRELYNKLIELKDKNNSIQWFSIEVINEESIHQHNAYARMEFE